MKTIVCFKKDDMVKIFNPNNYYHGDVAKVLWYDEYVNKYLLELINGNKCFEYSYNVVKYLKEDEEYRLIKAQLLQLADLALMLNDKDWFNDAVTTFRSFT